MEIAVPRTEKLSLVAGGIIAGGLLLGAALGSFARPVPKTPADPPWAGMLHSQPAESAAVYYASASSTPNLPDSYPPPGAKTELAWWPADLKLPRDGEYKPEPLPSLKEDARPKDPPADTFADRDVEVPHYAAIEKAAQQAQDTLRDADTAEQDPAEQAQPAPSTGPKVVYFAQQGDR